ncbi:glycoside hydrolase family 3 protein [Collybiopsis luxurians FD-317 M1]|uniref:Glycoside hydrolase family 3 protein n=1 Tax=Collybiopsis luxurians FD-317 M1 TaxID=944289 RepID=A0A0D0D336_9AGAR|nr:glycoside hydrolase family 3 protein [Collybiopsis luxurians FD-317 M1]
MLRFAALFFVPAALASSSFLEPRKFSLVSRGTNLDGSLPTYKNPNASIEDRVADLLPRMTLEEKVAQIIQGDIDGWMDTSNPLDNTLVFNQSGLVREAMISTKAGSIWAGYQMPYEKFVFALTVGQKYLMENTTLGIPAMFQSEGLHGFTNNGTIFPSPIGLAASFNPALLSSVANIISTEAEGLGLSEIFAPVLDMSRELRWGRVEENYGEDPFLTGEMGQAYVSGLQDGTRRNVTAGGSGGIRKRMASTCKHFTAYGSPMNGLNLAPVVGTERDLRTIYLPAFQKACMESLAIMTAYASYDSVPVRLYVLTDILRDEWQYPYWVTTDAGSVDLLITFHKTCDTRECAAKAVIENGLSGEMGGGSYTYLTLPDQVAAGTVNESFIDETVKAMLRTKFTLGLFESPYPYDDYLSTIRTPESREVLLHMEEEAIVLLENNNNLLPLKNVSSVALIGPQANRVTASPLASTLLTSFDFFGQFGDYVFFNASLNGITPLAGFQEFLSNSSSSTKVNFAQGCELWSNDQSGIAEAVSTAQASDVAIVMVGTWSLDQTLLWTPGTNATTGEHVDLSDLSLVGAQLALVQAVINTGTPTVVVFVSGKPVTEPWIKEHADAVIQQFYPGELGGLALPEIIFGAVNPSGKLPVSFPQSVGTTPDFYNWLNGMRPIPPDPGMITDNGTLIFAHEYVLGDPVPLWAFGRGLSYTTFSYSGLSVPRSIGTTDNFNVTVTVHNTGSVEGKEVVQVYLSDLVSSVVTPNQRLVGFQKISLAAGASQTVSIEVQSSQLAVWNLNNEWAVEPGVFIIKVGTSEEVFAQANLTVTA